MVYGVKVVQDSAHPQYDSPEIGLEQGATQDLLTHQGWTIHFLVATMLVSTIIIISIIISYYY